VHLNVPPIEIIWSTRLIRTRRWQLTPLAQSGTGTCADVANAVFNETGKRIRNLPLTPDKLM